MTNLKQKEQNKECASANIFDAYTKALQNYFNFKGRTSRYDYWGFYAVNFLIAFVLALFGLKVSSFSMVHNIYSLALLIPTWAAICRRLHDIGKSAFWYLFLPIFVAVLLGVVGFKTQNHIMFGLTFFAGMIYTVILLVWLCYKGEEKDNIFGPQIVETPRQKKVGKWLCIIFLVLPLVMILIAVVSVFSSGVISGYTKAMEQYQKNQAFQQESVLRQHVNQIQSTDAINKY